MSGNWSLLAPSWLPQLQAIAAAATILGGVTYSIGTVCLWRPGAAVCVAGSLGGSFGAALLATFGMSLLVCLVSPLLLSGLLLPTTWRGPSSCRSALWLATFCVDVVVVLALLVPSTMCLASNSCDNAVPHATAVVMALDVWSFGVSVPSAVVLDLRRREAAGLGAAGLQYMSLPTPQLLLSLLTATVGMAWAVAVQAGAVACIASEFQGTLRCGAAGATGRVGIAVLPFTGMCLLALAQGFNVLWSELPSRLKRWGRQEDALTGCATVARMAVTGAGRALWLLGAGMALTPWAGVSTMLLYYLPSAAVQGLHPEEVLILPFATVALLFTDAYSGILSGSSFAGRAVAALNQQGSKDEHGSSAAAAPLLRSRPTPAQLQECEFDMQQPWFAPRNMRLSRAVALELMRVSSGESDDAEAELRTELRPLLHAVGFNRLAGLDSMRPASSKAPWRRGQSAVAGGQSDPGKYHHSLAFGTLGTAALQAMTALQWRRPAVTDDLLHAAMCAYLVPDAASSRRQHVARSAASDASLQVEMAGAPAGSTPLAGAPARPVQKPTALPRQSCCSWAAMCCPHHGAYLRCAVCYDPLVILPGRPSSVVCKPAVLVALYLSVLGAVMSPALLRSVQGQPFAGRSEDAHFIVGWTIAVAALGKLRLYAQVDPILSTLVRLRQLTQRLLALPAEGALEPAVVSQWSAHLTFLLSMVRDQVGVKHGGALFGYSLAAVLCSGFLAVWVLIFENATRAGWLAVAHNQALWVLGVLALSNLSALLQMMWHLLAMDAMVVTSIERVRRLSFNPRVQYDLTAFMTRMEARSTLARDALAVDQAEVLAARYSRRAMAAASASGDDHRAALLAGPQARGRRADEEPVPSPLPSPGVFAGGGVEDSHSQLEHQMMYAATVAQAWGAHYKGIQLPLFGMQGVMVTLSTAYWYGIVSSAVLAGLSFAAKFVFLRPAN